MADTLKLEGDKAIEFNSKFISVASQLVAHPILGSLVRTKEPGYGALLAFQIGCLERELYLGEPEVEMVRGFQVIMTSFAKPHQMPLLGQDLYNDVIQAKEYLATILPTEKQIEL